MALHAASSSSSAPFSPKKFDVFISFRGEDTRTNFTSHLYDAFCRKQIHTYIDYRLNKGDEISSALMQAIEDSYVSVVIFSENYGSSRWCLDELIHILHCRKVQAQVVIPVFYKVDPSHVRHQNGTYKTAFEKHLRNLKHQHKVPNWKGALNEVANLAGWDSRTFRDDSELIQKIVVDVLRKLDHRYPPIELKGLVGIDKNCAHVESLLREVQTIGIWGMGGIGKTTIAQVIFSKYSSQYEGRCFLENVRENSGKQGNGLHDLRCILVSELLDEENSHKVTSIESNFDKCRLKRMKVFIVLDDVNTLEQLECLALDGEHHCFGPGSRIIITTRDKHVLSKGIDEIYEVKELEFQDSIHLFNLNAFNQNQHTLGYEDLTERAVTYCKGIPLALKVLGSLLRGKSEDEWNSALKKLEKIPHENIQNMLKLSYDGLDHEEKQIFLDIAFFLNGMSKERVMSLLDSCGFYGAIGIRTLEDKALITVDHWMGIRMHELIREMGCQIVCEESINEPERRSRLCDSGEVYDILTENKGTNKVEGIVLNMSQISDLHLSGCTFEKMPNIRFLKFYSNFYYNSGNKVHLPDGLKLFPNKIRYLEWHMYPLKSLPSTFCAKRFVELHMPNSHVQKLWDGVQELQSLKEINLSESKQLMELPDLSKASSLEKVCLDNCESLDYVHSSILSLHSLVELSLDGCKKLKSLKSEIHSKSLEYLNVDHCENLKEFSVSSEKLLYLDLRETEIEILHSSIGCSSNLDQLYFKSSRLKELPNEISCLRVLTILSLCNCEVIDNSKLQILLDGLKSLMTLQLDDCNNITELPNNIQHLSRLHELSLNGCKKLRFLPKLPPSILFLEANDCTSLETQNGGTKNTSFGNCLKLNEESLHNIIEVAHFEMIEVVHPFQQNRVADFLRRKYSFGTAKCFPGSRVPKWFRNRTSKGSITIELPPFSSFLGLFCCFVLQFATPKEFFKYHLECECYLGDNNMGSFTCFNSNGPSPRMKSDHVFILDTGRYCRDMSDEIERRRGNDQFVTNLKLCLKVVFIDYRKYINGGEELDPSITVKEFGVCPLYVSEYKDLGRQMELNKNNKRLRDDEEDEDEVVGQFKRLKLDLSTESKACQDINEFEALFMRMDIT